MRILVVDDEQIMLDSICHILAQATDLQLETARTGREAIEKAESIRPELVIMDIKMPGINGLEALTEIRRMDPQVVLVILSAYESFNYAQEAIRLNVYDYLVKPINKKRLLELTENVSQHLVKVRSLRREELDLRERYKKLTPLIENELIWELISGIDVNALAEYEELLGEKIRAGFFLVISYHEKTRGAVENLTELEYMQRQKMTHLGDEIRTLAPCFVGSFRSHPILVFVPVGQPEERTSNPRELAQRILIRLQNGNHQTNIRIGIGRIYKTAPEMKRSYQEALMAHSDRSQNQIQHVDDLPGSQISNWETDLKIGLQDILGAVRFGNGRQALTWLESLLPKYSNLKESEQDRLFFYLLEFLLAAFRLAQENSQFSDNLQARVGECSFGQMVGIFAKKDLPRIFDVIRQRIDGYTRIIKEGREKQVKGIIRRAKEIIDHQFREALNLEEVSHKVGISPFYFSRLFREELGISFSEYLTKVRMESALTLLAQGLAVKECCYLVGYHDPNYFSRIFRKFYDISPSEYQDEKCARARRFKGGENSDHD